MSQSHDSIDPFNGAEVAVIGMSCRMPGARNIGEFWNNIREGVESISFFSDEELRAAGVQEELLKDRNYVRANGSLEDIENFDAAFFGIGKREAEIMDPQHRIFIEEAYKALDDAGYSNVRHRSRVAVFAGCDMNTYLLTNMKYHEDQVRAAGDFLLMMSSDKDYLPTRTSYLLNLNGPSINVQTACSTSLVAIHLACQSLISAESEIAIAGGASIRPPMKQGYRYVRDMINSPDGHCRPFDSKAEGTVGGNGVGVVVLKLLGQAIRDGDHIYAVIKGSAINNDGANKAGFTAPSVRGQSEVIVEAMAMAEADPSSIGFLETHGTGTKLGDAIEFQALSRAFSRALKKKKFCAMGALKANIGHTSSAAGVAGFIKTVLVVNHGLIPPLVNFNEINPGIPLEDTPFYIPLEKKPWLDNIRRAGVSSFGIGGTNAHIVLENYREPHRESASTKAALISLSAKSPESLRQSAANLCSVLQDDRIVLQDIAFTCHVGREHLTHRLSVVCSSRQELYEVLTSQSGKKIIRDRAAETEPPVFFLFPGQGSQYPEMAAGLYHENNRFRHYFDTCAELLNRHLKYDIRAIIIKDGGYTYMPGLALQTEYAQPLIFSIEFSLASVLMEYGVKPAGVIGHSLGDFTAAVIAGIMTPEDALMLVSQRGKLMQACAPGAMVSVMLSVTEAQKKLNGNQVLSIAAINAPSGCVISGPVDSITMLEEKLHADQVPFQRLATAHAFHNPMMDSCAEAFRKLGAGIRWSLPALPVVSNVDGELLSHDKPIDIEYWISQLRNPVNFDKGVRQLLKYPSAIFIEAGPGKTLTGFIRQNPLKKDGHTLVTLLTPQAQQTEGTRFLEGIGQLWAKGIAIDFERMYAGSGAQRCSLPSYPFTAQRYWIQNKERRNEITELKNSISFFAPVWKQGRILPAQQERHGDRKLLLLFLFNDSLAQPFLNVIRPDEYRIATVIRGECFSVSGEDRYILNPGSADDYGMLFDSLQARQNEKISILLNGTSSGPPGTPVEQALYELVLLARHIGSLPRHMFSLHVLTNNIHRVTGEELPDPAHGLLLGASKIIPLEYANIRTKAVDISQAEGASKAVCEMVIKEFDVSDDQAGIAIRGRQRFVMDYEAVEAGEAPAYRLRENGVYMITGGFRGIGVQIAMAIASEKPGVKIVLVGRSEMPDEPAWPAIIRDSGHPMHNEITQLHALKNIVSGLKLMPCDVSDLGKVKHMVSAIYDEWKEINGVIHAAGLADYHGIVHQRTRENLLDILKPKVHGALALDSCIDYERLDFFVLFSTISTTFYKTKAGQVGYLAANEFIDAFGEYHSSIGKHKTTVINWNDWSEVGMSVKANARLAAMLGIDIHHAVFSDALNSAEGQETFLKLLGAGHTRVIVSRRNVTEEFRRYGKFNLGEFVRGIRQERAKAPAVLAGKPDNSAPLTELQQTISRIWMECLGVEAVGLHDNFFDLGGHSLLATQVISRMQENIPAHLVPSLESIFKYPTIHELSEFIENLGWLQHEVEVTTERDTGSI